MTDKDNWRDIWGSRCTGIAPHDVLGSLIKANGFDTGCGDYTTDQWKLMTSGLCNLLNIRADSKVLEVGCGAGALLYCIQQCTQAKVFGYDYSSALISICEQYVEGEFRVSEAPINPFRSIKFDFAISHSVFQYFANEQYAVDTIRTMALALAPGGSIALLDINDSEYEEKYHKTRKLHYRNPAEYEERYGHLPHLFISRECIAVTLEELGFREIGFVDHPIAEYKNAQYRFNVLAKKL